jgi:hypothetical protein
MRVLNFFALNTSVLAGDEGIRAALRTVERSSQKAEYRQSLGSDPLVNGDEPFSR